MFQRCAVGVQLALDLVALHVGQHIVHAVQLVDGVGLERVDAAGHQHGGAKVDGRPAAQGHFVQRVGQVIVAVAAKAGQVGRRVQLGTGVVDSLSGFHRTAQDAHRLGHVGHGGGVQGAVAGGLGGSLLVQLRLALRGDGPDLGLLVVGRQRIAGVVHQRELHGLDVVALVVDVVGVLSLGHGGGAVRAVGQVQDGLGLLGVQQIRLHRGLGDTVGGVQVAVGTPQAVGRVGSLGGGSVIQRAAQLVELLLDGGVILDGAGGQLADIVSAVGGDLLTVDGAGALSLQHRFDVAGGLAGRQFGQAGSRVVGVVLGQQVDTGRDLDPADGADIGGRGHGAAAQSQQHGSSHAQAEQFGFDRTHGGSPLILILGRA